MTRTIRTPLIRGAAATILLLLALGCGRYGPPVRTWQPPEEETTTETEALVDDTGTASEAEPATPATNEAEPATPANEAEPATPANEAEPATPANEAEPATPATGAQTPEPATTP